MKFSLVITVLNEEKTINNLLKSLDKQTRKSDEVIFVDGGSIDNTIKLLKKWASNKRKVKIWRKAGFSIAQGRNFGISKTCGDVVVHTDAGCVPRRDWFEKIVAPFLNSKKNIDIVSGFYAMTGSSIFQKSLSIYLGTPSKRIDSNKFLPSTRSIAFKKKIWRKIGGFPEKLSKAGEDTFFNYLANKSGAKFYFQKGAIVEWEMPQSLAKALMKFYFYAKGDAQSGVFWDPVKKFYTHNLKVLFIFLRYFIGLILMILSFKKDVVFFWVLTFLLIFYLIWSICKNYFLLKNWRAIYWLPIIQTLSDLFIMAGFVAGFVSKITKKL